MVWGDRKIKITLFTNDHNGINNLDFEVAKCIEKIIK